MGLEDVLKGYQPQENMDTDGFQILKGTYLCAVTKLAVDSHEQYGERYQLELTVNEVVDGNGNPGRKFWKRYRKDDEGVKKLLNDLLTAGIELDRGSVEAFEGSFPNALDKDVTVRAWGWTPTKTVSGEPIPEEDQQETQTFKIVNAKKVKTKKKSASTPF